MILTDCQQVILWALFIAPEDPKGFKKYRDAERIKMDPEARKLAHARSVKHRAENLESIREKMRERRANNLEHQQREREYSKKYRERFPERLEIDNNRRRRMSRNFDLLKMDRPCYDCGGVFLPCQMDWDHLPQFKKSFDIAKKMSRKFDSVIDEINKCQLVCASCHRLRTELRQQKKDKVT